MRSKSVLEKKTTFLGALTEGMLMSEGGGGEGIPGISW